MNNEEWTQCACARACVGVGVLRKDKHRICRHTTLATNRPQISKWFCKWLLIGRWEIEADSVKWCNAKLIYSIKTCLPNKKRIANAIPIPTICCYSSPHLSLASSWNYFCCGRSELRWTRTMECKWDKQWHGTNETISIRSLIFLLRPTANEKVQIKTHQRRLSLTLCRAFVFKRDVVEFRDPSVAGTTANVWVTTGDERIQATSVLIIRLVVV